MKISSLPRYTEPPAVGKPVRTVKLSTPDNSPLFILSVFNISSPFLSFEKKTTNDFRTSKADSEMAPQNFQMKFTMGY